MKMDLFNISRDLILIILVFYAIITQWLWVRITLSVVVFIMIFLKAMIFASDETTKMMDKILGYNK